MGLSTVAYRHISDPASTSGSGSSSRDVFHENMDTSQSFDDDDSESDISESRPPSPDSTDSEAEVLALLNGKLVDNCLIIAIDLFFGS